VSEPSEYGVKEIKVIQYRLESLLLDLIHERLAASAPPARPEEGGEVNDRYLGYCEGYWDALQRHSDITDEHRENNDYRLGR